MKTSRLLLPLALALTPALALGCRDGSQAKGELPPATGPGAPPRPKLPKVDEPKTKIDEPGKAGADETTGTTHPKERAEVAPNSSGVIARIDVEEGDQVKKGQILFRLRTQDLGLRVKQAKAALKSAQVRLSSVKVEYDRMKKLFEKNAIDEASWDKTRAQYEASQAAVDQAKVGVSMAHKALSDATVRSPIAGVVTAKLKNEGEMATMMPPSVVVVVENHSILELRFRLPERKLGSLEVGDKVRAEFRAVGLTREATVTRVSPNVDAHTRTFEVVADLDNRDGALKSGMLATVISGDSEAAPPAGKEDAGEAR